MALSSPKPNKQSESKKNHPARNGVDRKRERKRQREKFQFKTAQKAGIIYCGLFGILLSFWWSASTRCTAINRRKEIEEEDETVTNAMSSHVSLLYPLFLPPPLSLFIHKSRSCFGKLVYAALVSDGRVVLADVDTRFFENHHRPQIAKGEILPSFCTQNDFHAANGEQTTRRLFVVNERSLEVRRTLNKANACWPRNKKIWQ